MTSARSDIKELIGGRFLPGPLLMKRNPQSTSSLGLCDIGETPIKDKRIYTSLTQTMAFSHLKPKGYELVHLPYDMYCPSVQSKLKDSRCQLSTCFTTLDLAKRHSMLSGHSDLTMTMTMDDEEPIHAIEENDQAPIVSAGEFLKLPFVTDDE